MRRPRHFTPPRQRNVWPDSAYPHRAPRIPIGPALTRAHAERIVDYTRGPAWLPVEHLVPRPRVPLWPSLALVVLALLLWWGCR